MGMEQGPPIVSIERPLSPPSHGDHRSVDSFHRVKTIRVQFGRPIALWLALSTPLFVSSTQGQQTDPTATEFEMPEPIGSVEDIVLQTPFTFVRIEYSGHPDRVRGGWTTDYPTADQAFSRYFQRLTGLATNLDGLTLRLTDPTLR